MALIFKKVHTISALLSMFFGVGTWISVEFFLSREEIFFMPAHFFAFLIAIVAFFLGQVLSRWISNNNKYLTDDVV